MPARDEQGHLLGEEGLEAQSQLRRRRGAEAEVELAVGHAAADTGRSGHVQPHAQRGPLALELSEERHDPLARGGLDRADAQQAAPAVAQLRHAARQRVEGVEDGQRPLREELAGGSQRALPSAPVEELEPGLGLELLDVQGHGGLGEAERAGRLEEAPLPEHGLEGQEVARVHHVDSLFLTL